MEKSDFINVLDCLQRQYLRDLAAHASYDNAGLWEAATLALAAALGGGESFALIQKWICDCEFGKYPDERIPAKNNEELWEFLAIPPEK